MFYVDTKLVGGCVVMMRLMLCYCKLGFLEFEDGEDACQFFIISSLNLINLSLILHHHESLLHQTLQIRPLR